MLPAPSWPSGAAHGHHAPRTAQSYPLAALTSQRSVPACSRLASPRGQRDRLGADTACCCGRRRDRARPASLSRWRSFRSASISTTRGIACPVSSYTGPILVSVRAMNRTPTEYRTASRTALRWSIVSAPHPGRSPLSSNAYRSSWRSAKLARQLGSDWFRCSCCLPLFVDEGLLGDQLVVRTEYFVKLL